MSMELDLPTGTDSGGGDHLAKFLSTLTELVDLLGKTGPGGASGGASPTGGAADSTGGKNLIKATAKLFNDLANAFKPLKTVLSKFGAISPAAAQPAAVQPAPIALEAPAAAEAQADEAKAKPKRKGRKKKGAADDAEQGQESTPVAALTIQDASIGIDFASVKMPAAPPKAKPKEDAEQPVLLAKLVDIDTNLVKITVPTASFKIASALLQGTFLMPPEAARPAPTPKAPKPEKTAPKAEKPTPTPKAPAQAKPRTAEAASGEEQFTAGNVMKRFIKGQKQFSFGEAFKAILKGGRPGAGAGAGKSNDAQEKNTAAKEASQNLQSAIVNIANGVVNVHAAGEKKGKAGEPEHANDSEAAKKFAQGQANQVKGTGPKLMPKGGAGVTKMMPKMGGGGAAKMMPKMGVGAMGAMSKMGAAGGAVGSVATGGLALVALIAAKAAEPIVNGVAAPFKAIGGFAMDFGKTLSGAITDPIATFAKLSAVMIGFVSVINPAAVDHFNRAIKDTTAVIGKSMIGALNVFTTVQREFADVLSPIMRNLTSTITSVATSMGGMFFGMIRMGGVAVTVLMPIFKAIGAGFSMFFDIIGAVTESLAVIIGGFSGLFTGIDGAVSSLATAIVDIVKVIARSTVQMVALIAKIFGATGFLNGMKKVAQNKGAAERDNTTGMANPTGAHFESAEGFGKSIAQASFTATSAGAAPKKTDDFLADIAADMEAISQMDLKQVIIDAIVAAGKTAVKETASTVGTVAYEASGMGVVNRTGAALGEWVGGMLFG